MILIQKIYSRHNLQSSVKSIASSKAKIYLYCMEDDKELLSAIHKLTNKSIYFLDDAYKHKE